MQRPLCAPDFPPSGCDKHGCRDDAEGEPAKRPSLPEMAASRSPPSLACSIRAWFAATIEDQMPPRAPWATTIPIWQPPHWLTHLPVPPAGLHGRPVREGGWPRCPPPGAERALPGACPTACATCASLAFALLWFTWLEGSTVTAEINRYDGNNAPSRSGSGSPQVPPARRRCRNWGSTPASLLAPPLLCHLSF